MSKGKKLLIVDDEPDLREILADEFRFSGAEVIEAANGVVALEIYKKDSPDAVVSDIRMPGGDGVTLAKAIKAIDCGGSRVFLVTGFADLSPAEAFEFGVDGFFTKPFHLEEVRDNVLNSLLPYRERWTQKIDVPEGQEVKIHSTDLKADFSTGKFVMGRGGFFLPQNLIAEGKMHFRNGELIRVGCQNEKLGVCKVRWMRSESESLKLGLGLEYVSLEPEFLDFVVKFLETSGVCAYIPSTVTS